MSRDLQNILSQHTISGEIFTKRIFQQGKKCFTENT